MLKPLFAATLLVFLSACGGRLLLEGTDAGAGTAPEPTPSEDSGALSPSPASTGDPFPICPHVQPNAGDVCPTANRGCAYLDFDGSCVSWTCDGHNVWAVSTPAGCP